MSTVRSSSGFALVSALVALVIIGALIAGAFFASTHEHGAGLAALHQTRALDAAESGVQQVIGGWDRSRNIAMPVGASLGPDSLPTGAGSWAVVRITRLGAMTFWIVSEGRSGASTTARRRIAALVRLALADVPRHATVTTRGWLLASGPVRVIGSDSAPAGWTGAGVCPAAPPLDVAGAAAPDTMRICDGTCGVGAGTRIVGAPNLHADSAAADTASFFGYGSVSWLTLTTRADIVVAGGAPAYPAPRVTGGACDVNATTNWGDPTRVTACADHHPVVWYRGDLDLTGGSGQGILLVDGNLSIRGPFTYAGIIVVRGDVDVTSDGSSIAGTMFIGGVAAGATNSSRIGGANVLQHSSCAIDRARIAAATLAPAGGRSWSELF